MVELLWYVVVEKQFMGLLLVVLRQADEVHTSRAKLSGTGIQAVEPKSDVSDADLSWSTA